jgi:hypothetical protein
LDELEANRQSRKSAWATLLRLRKFLETNGARISIPEDRSFETEGEALESGLKRTIAGRDAVMRSLIQAVYRFRDAALVDEKKDDFGSALQNLYWELERAENLAGTLLIVRGFSIEDQEIEHWSGVKFGPLIGERATPYKKS